MVTKCAHTISAEVADSQEQQTSERTNEEISSFFLPVTFGCRWLAPSRTRIHTHIHMMMMMCDVVRSNWKLLSPS